MIKHSPLPWTLSEQDAYEVRDTKRLIVASVYRVGSPVLEEESNAEFICRACNNHDSLIEALQYWVDAAQNDDRYAAWLGKARAAIAKATEHAEGE